MQERTDASGRKFYIDHNTKNTTWVRPDPPPAASMAVPAAEGAVSEQSSVQGGSPASSSLTDVTEALPASSAPPEFGLFGLSLEEVITSLAHTILNSCRLILHNPSLPTC